MNMTQNFGFEILEKIQRPSQAFNGQIPGPKRPAQAFNGQIPGPKLSANPKIDQRSVVIGICIGVGIIGAGYIGYRIYKNYNDEKIEHSVTFKQ